MGSNGVAKMLYMEAQLISNSVFNIIHSPIEAIKAIPNRSNQLIEHSLGKANYRSSHCQSDNKRVIKSSFQLPMSMFFPTNYNYIKSAT